MKVRHPRPILIVDDDELVVEQLALVLRDAGYLVVTAAAAAEALRAIDRHGPRIMVVDWEMPEMSGPALCRHIRQLNAAQYLYILLFTIRNRREDIVEGLSSGADDHLTKGASLEELLVRIKKGSRRVAHLDAAADWRRCYRTHDPKIVTPLPFGLARELEVCQRQSLPVSLLLCALDDPTELHAAVGPEAAREFLMGLQSEASKTLLDSEWVAACGSDGFAIVLPGASLPAASFVAKKVRAALDAFGQSFSAPLRKHSSLSIGIACVDTASDLSELRPLHLLRAAQRCLGESLRQGGSRTNATQLTPLDPARQ